MKTGKALKDVEDEEYTEPRDMFVAVIRFTGNVERSMREAVPVVVESSPLCSVGNGPHNPSDTGATKAKITVKVLMCIIVDSLEKKKRSTENRNSDPDCT